MNHEQHEQAFNIQFFYGLKKGKELKSRREYVRKIGNEKLNFTESCLKV